MKTRVWSRRSAEKQANHLGQGFRLAIFFSCLLLSLAALAQEPAATYTQIDAPGGVNGTVAIGVNTSGVIAGYSIDSNNVYQRLCAFHGR